MFASFCRRLPIDASSLLHPYRPSASHRSYGNNTTSSLTFLGAALGLTASFAISENESPYKHTPVARPSRTEYKYLICGGGIAAQEALGMFKEQSEAHNVLLVSPEWKEIQYQPKVENEEYIPMHNNYNPISALFSVFSSPFSPSLPRDPPANEAEVLIGPRVISLDCGNRIATLDDGLKLSFERCLIAVGTSMPDIPVGKVVSTSAENLVSGAQTRSDWRHINSIIPETSVPYHSTKANGMQPPHLTVVGGGWMSPIVGATLVQRGAHVTFSYAEPSFLARYFPKYMAQDVLSRLVWQSNGGVDTLSYSTVRYVVARSGLGEADNLIEAEVHVGTIFDALSIMDFRTDHVIFAPTVASKIPLHAPSLSLKRGGIVTNAELAAASDVYVAGSAISVGSGAICHPEGMRWSADHARATGRHAALNMLGARNAFSYTPTMTVELDALRLRVHVMGDVDGGAESFGYFLKCRNGSDDTCGGQLEFGVLFCLKPAPLRHRGAAQRLVVSGVALWEGCSGMRIEDVEETKRMAVTLMEGGALTRPQLEAATDRFATEQLGISLHGRETSTAVKENDSSQECNDEMVKKSVQNMSLGKSRGNVIWRRHKAARSVQIAADEILWIEKKWIGED